MKRILYIVSALSVAGIVFAQSPQRQTIISARGSQIPVTTVVDVQDAPVRVADSTTVYMSSNPKKMTRAQRRARKADAFAYTVDSLVRSRNFVFYPNTMQEIPDGAMNNIFADYYYLGFFADSMEVHLPSVNGDMQFVRMLNFDSAVSDYKLLPFQSGLTSTFTIVDDGNTLFGRFVISTVTGETVLTLLTPDTTMRYVGWLSRERRQDERDDMKAEQL